MNNKVISTLRVANKVTDIYAYLVDELGSTVYTFLYNPQDKQFSKEAKYNEAPTAISSLPAQQYVYTTGLTLQLQNLILTSRAEGKTVKSLIEGLQALMVADPSKGKYAPTPVTFKWGSDRFGPAVINNISWTETSWLGGEVDTATVNLSLIQIPDSMLPAKAKAQTLEGALARVANTTFSLTSRQQSDAIIQASQALLSNQKKLSSTILPLVKSSLYNLTVDKSGTVSMSNKAGAPLGTVGIYSNLNGQFDISKGTIISMINQQDIVTFKPGDSLSKIAHSTYGDYSKWRDIADSNLTNIFKPLGIGSVLKLPTAADIQSKVTSAVNKEYNDLLKKLDLSSITTGSPFGVTEPWKIIDWIL